MHDLKNMTTEELDGLMVAAAQERAERKQPMPVAPPDVVWFAGNVAWQCKTYGDGILICFQHPGYGLVAFTFTRAYAAQINSAVLYHILSNTTPSMGPAEVIIAPSSEQGSGQKH